LTNILIIHNIKGRGIVKVREMIDIKDFEEVLDTLNAIINNRGTAEIKLETPKEGGQKIVVVEISRSVKLKKTNA